MKTVKRKITILILLVTATFHIFPTAVWANSAMKAWDGTDASGVSVMEKACPVTVKNEKLTFDIPMFPDYYYGDSEDFVEYRASVTARYEFYNPKNYDVTTALAFPFGVFPEYVDAGNEDFYSPTSLDRYGVTLNGEATETVLRHTYFDRYGETFDTAEQLARLRGNFAEGGFLHSGTRVTAYNYNVTDTNSEDGCYASFEIDGIGESRYAVTDYGYYSFHGDGVKVGVYINEAKGDNSFTVYIIGSPIPNALQPQLFKNSRENQKAEGTVTLKSTDQMTLYDFAMMNYDPEGDIMEIDRFNAVIDCIITSWENGKIISEWGILNIDQSLMRWYMYEMTVPAGETVINDVTAPLYPDIDDGFVPSLYTYNYLLSPARSWAGFGKLDIEIITPYYLIECDIFPEFEKTESGYATSLNGLPSGELRFTLSSDPSPKREITPYTFLGIGLYAVIIGVTVVLPAAAIITVTVIIVKKHRKTR